MKLELAFKKTPDAKHLESANYLINIGAMMDVPTARFERGMRGEFIMIAGCGVVMGLIGGPNMYKSTIGRHIMIGAAATVAECGKVPYIDTYDTELTFVPSRGVMLSQRYRVFKGYDLMELGAWKLTDAVGATGDVWFADLKEFILKDKIKDRSYQIETPFMGRDGKPVRVIFPSFSEVDSVSEFRTADVDVITDKNKLGESGGNVVFLRAGLIKTRFLMELTGLCAQGNHYTILTAHIGEKFDMNSGPMAPKPTKDLTHMKTNETIKGVPDKFYFLPTVVYQANRVQPLIDANKRSEYPRTQHEGEVTNVDLNRVHIRVIRNKVGTTGIDLSLVVSQSQGVLPTVTEFDHLREFHSSYSFNRSGGTYNSVFLPDVKFSRNTIREKVDSGNEGLLVRAVNIGAELLQMGTLQKDTVLNYLANIPGPESTVIVPTPDELYTKLASKYDWNILLAARGKWTFNQYTHPEHYLSIMDLIMMFHDRYHPFWYDAEVKRLEKEAAKKAA